LPTSIEQIDTAQSSWQQGAGRSRDQLSCGRAVGTVREFRVPIVQRQPPVTRAQRLRFLGRPFVPLGLASATTAGLGHLDAMVEKPTSTVFGNDRLSFVSAAREVPCR
jgi:hypothetical protein